MQKERAYSFYQWSAKDIEKHFEVSAIAGLSLRSATHRLSRIGKNSFSDIVETGPLNIFFRQFSNFFILILFIASVISYFVDGIVQALIIMAIIVANILLGFIQEFKAEKALASLKNSVKAQARVLREGKVTKIASEDVVPGDIVIVESGDIVPADLRILEANSLQINESSLTGESLPVEKNSEILPIDTPLADRKNMLFGSTIVTAGNGKGLVIGTGRNTEFGKIAGLISEQEEKTPLEKQIAYLAKTLTVLSSVAVLIIFVLGYFRGYEILPLSTFVIALLVGAVPESLPTVITLALAIGVSRMAKHKAIVRRLAAVETLGTVNVIATDKTGTLTDNELTVNSIVTKNFKTIEKQDIARTLSVSELFAKSVICSNIKYSKSDLMGDPLEIGIAKKALSLKIRPYKVKRLMEIPFDSKNQYMAVLVSINGKKEMIVKGAPEKIAEYCKKKSDSKKIKMIAESLSKNGLKVIAIASKMVDRTSFSSIENLNFLGLIGMVDEPSDGIKEAIEKTIAANIRPIILTGDHPETARFVAQKIGFSVNDDEILTGMDLQHLSDKELKNALAKVKVFARITPEDKINIVDKLEHMGLSVIVTGDGVNDAAAIKRASVGVAMGIKGTDVAKDSSDIILSDDRYATIVSAIEYGRTVYDNIKNVVIFLISGNIDILAIVAIAFLCNLPMPILTIQILWINMVTDTLPAVALAFEKPSPAVLSEKPRSGEMKSMKQPVVYAIYLSIIGIALGLVAYLWGLSDSANSARTLLFNYIVFMEIVFGFSVRSKKRIWQKPKEIFSNRYLNLSFIGVILIQIIIAFEPFSKALSLASISTKEIVLLAILIITTFFVAEVVRYRIDKKHSI